MAIKIGLIDADSHNFPNIPLMKVSAWHKKQGDYVEFAENDSYYDRVYLSKVFTESPDPEIPDCKELIKGGSGYDLKNKLPEDIEHTYPDYSLYPDLTRNTAYGMLTRGCPRLNHKFCITPKKDGCVSKKVADLSKFWNGQKNICLLDQNILACKERKELLQQLIDSHATVEFNGGIDARYMTSEIIEMVRQIKVKDYHFAWDDPKEDLKARFQEIKESGIKKPDRVGIYVLTNYWSTTEEDLYRVHTLREMGFMPFVMVYDKKKFVNDEGRWLPGVENKYSMEQLQHFKVCQHMQRWAGNRRITKSCPDFRDYERYQDWIKKGMPVPGG